jgi:ParB family chromosome partitioning protein
MNEEVQMIPIDQIRIINPRLRNKAKFELIVDSIKKLGLKKPIQVSLRSADEGSEPGYDLVCGQGRIEACMALGYKEIPAIVVAVSKEERLVRSLVENAARRFPVPADLLREIERLKTLGYINGDIAKKLGVSESYISNLMTLKKAGEERLISEALNGKIPLWVAMDIAKTDDVEMQRELLKGLESKKLNHISIRVVKRIIEQRRFLGKKRVQGAHDDKASADTMVTIYRRECQRQKLLVRKAKLCEEKLLFLVKAFDKLVADENFINLLRAEGLLTMPKYLSAKVSQKNEEAA